MCEELCELDINHVTFHDVKITENAFKELVNFQNNNNLAWLSKIDIDQPENGKGNKETIKIKKIVFGFSNDKLGVNAIGDIFNVIEKHIESK